MFKPTLFNIIFYIFFKYLIVYVIFMIATNDYRMLQISNIKSGQDLFYYLWLMTFLPIVSIVLFSIPYFFSFRIRNNRMFVTAILAILFLEYLFYVYFNSQKQIDLYGVSMVSISLIVFYLFFFKRINLFFQNK